MALPTNFVETANRRYTDSRSFFMNWRGEARDDYDFVSGKQWDEADKTKLKDEDRPAVTFNYSEKMVDAVAGAEVSNRQEVTYRPREVTDAATADVWNNAAKWARDGCDADDEESDSFRDCLICGMGWTRTKMNYEEDLDGRIEVHRVDPIMMLWDQAAIKSGLKDRRFHFFEWWVDNTEAHKEWPDTFVLGSSTPDTPGGSTITRGDRYNEESEAAERDMHKDQVLIRVYECVEREVVYRVALGDDMKELSPAEFGKMKADFVEQGIAYTKQYKKVYYLAYFSGETLLEGDVSPIQTGFTFNAITGKRDRNKNYWYGLTRVMKDPQRWANKWLSQILHIVNSNAKGGLMAEVGAFVDPTKAQDEWSKPDSVTLLNEGGLGKVEQKAMTQYPQGLDRLMNFALQSLPMVTGINLEALGLAGREQANVLEQSRKQAAYGLLAPIFDSLRHYRKAQGRVMLEFITKYISDGRMVRIGGPDSAQFLPLTKKEGAMTYDVFVDQSPNAPDVKQKTWETLGQILPAMMKAGLPIPPDLLDYTPLPAALTIKWKNYVQQVEAAKKQQGPSPEQVQTLVEENKKMKEQLADKTQQMQTDVAKMRHDFSMEEQRFQRDSQLKVQELLADIAFRRQELQLEREVNQEKLNMEVAAHEQNMSNTAAKADTDQINSTLKTLVDVISKLTKDDTNG